MRTVGSNSHPQDQEEHALPSKPASSPIKSFTHVTNTSGSVCYTLLYTEDIILDKQYMNHTFQQFPVTWEMLTKRQLPDDKC